MTERIRIHVESDPDTRDEIENLAAREERTVAWVIRRLIAIGLEHVRDRGLYASALDEKGK